MVKDHCPLCKSKRLVFIDPKESRERLKAVVNNTAIDTLPEDMKNLISMLDLDKEMSEEEKAFYEEHGRKVLCQNCGMTYYEFDNYDNLEYKDATPVTYEEYAEYLRDRVTDEEFVNFVLDKSKVLSAFYLEALDQLISEYNEASFIAGHKQEDTLVN